MAQEEESTSADTDHEISEPGPRLTAEKAISGTLESEGGELWLDRFARYLGFGHLADQISPKLPPSYVYAVITVVGWTLLSAGGNIFVFKPDPIYMTNPYFLLQPVVLVGGVYGAHSLQRSYRLAIDEMKLGQRGADPDQFLNLIPPWLPWILFGTAATLQLIRTYADFGVFGPMGIIANGFVFPFVYAPILVQFFVIYIGIEFIAPWRLYKSDDVGIHFLDPHGVGGLRPLGELVKKAYYFVVGGLVVYALITYAPGVDGWGVSVTAGTIFTGVWGVTILTVGFAVLVLHRFLHREKRHELQELEAQLHEHIENPWKVREYTIPDDKTDEIEDIQQRIETVSKTREYPATFSIWTQLLLSVAIPKALQLFLAST